ncbi:MAG: PilW family protein [Cellvibrio sp.]|uniref:PilW family protein n=1 Tax=Cellvibrio sp. TaxID=1965322 RepID=UPI0031AD727F
MRLRQTGLSLVELMISITLGLILMAGVVQIFLSSKTVFNTQQGLSRIQETGRLAIEFLARDVRMAAFYGCYRPNPSVPGNELQNAALVIAGLHGNFAEGVRGYDSLAALPGGAGVVGASIKPLSSGVANVVIVRAAQTVGLPISKPNDANGVFAYSAEPADSKGCFDGMCANSAVVVSDCFKARVFRVAIAPTSMANDVNFRHNEGWGGGVITTENFVSGEVAAMNTIVYFLAQGASGLPSLWQKTNTEDALELLEGVEQMRISYSTTNNPNYRLASALPAADWPIVNSVRIEVVARSTENNVVDSPQPYTLGGVVIKPTTIVVPPATKAVDDRYLRQVFTSTIGIRARNP